MNSINNWPRGDEYQIAVQQPTIVFSDPDLKKCSVETDLLGLPKPYSGGFTTTYHLHNNSQHFAVRCFIRDIPDLQTRYSAIGNFLNSSTHDFFLPAICLNEGILINNRWYPVIKMNWVDGVPLNLYIQKNLNNSVLLKKLADSFCNLTLNLEQLGIAHGDLQHGNIIVKNDQLFLVDYDGMYLPELSNLKGNEIGHPNYQHPLRGQCHQEPNLDRFSEIVIYLAVNALVYNPDLWKKFDTSENILFCKHDFLDYRHSKLLNDLSQYNDLSVLVGRFKGVCRCKFEEIPTLNQFISGEFSYPDEIVNEPETILPVINPVSSEIFGSEKTVIKISHKNNLIQYVDSWVTVGGVIDEVISSGNQFEKNGPVITLNFGYQPNEDFSLFIYSSSIDAFKRRNIVPESFVQKYVHVSGLVRQDQGKLGMNLGVPSQIEVVDNICEQNIVDSSICEDIINFSEEGYPIIQATNQNQLSANVGKWVAIEGIIDEINQSIQGSNDNAQPVITLNFGRYPRDDVYLHIYSSTISAFKRRNISPESFVNKQVRVTGKLLHGQGKFRLNLGVPSQIQIIEEQNGITNEKNAEKRPFSPQQEIKYSVEGNPIISVTSPELLRKFIGQWICAEGIIEEIQSLNSPPEKNQPAMILNFGSQSNDRLSLVVYQSTLDTGKKRNIALESLKFPFPTPPPKS